MADNNMWLRIPPGPVRDAIRMLSDASATSAKGARGDKGDKGDKGDPGAPAASTTYRHSQASSSAVWSVSHGLGRKPSVVIVDSGGSTLFADVAYVDDNNLTITFSLPVSGYADCN